VRDQIVEELEAKEEAPLNEMGFETNPLEDPMEASEEEVTTSDAFETEVKVTKT
jgi:hypothetical protein